MIREFSLPYGKRQLPVKLPLAGFAGEFLPIRHVSGKSDEEIIEHALDNPVASKRVEELVKPGQKVVIVTSDMTRPCPSDVMLPPLLTRLNKAGVPDDHITIVIALGLHRKMTDEELRRIVGESVFNRVKVINHDADDVVQVGVTSRGTPVEIFRPVVEADFLICLGNVEFHYFAGFSGGAKAIIPGVASAKTIRQNHSHMIEDGAVTANIKNNPVRLDIEEGVKFIGIDFILNVIVDENHKIVAAASGDWIQAHRFLSRRLEETGAIYIDKKVDIAVVSAGGFPKDINLYQAQKAIDNCAGILKKDGIMILLAECPEGYGSETFRQWITSGKKPEELIQDIKNKFVLGGHKAAAIAKVAMKSRIFLVTSEKLANEKLTGIEIFTGADKAISKAFEMKGEKAEYAVFPLGASTLPRVKRGEN